MSATPAKASVRAGEQRPDAFGKTIILLSLRFEVYPCAGAQTCAGILPIFSPRFAANIYDLRLPEWGFPT
jgi:hypothetical protein